MKNMKPILIESSEKGLRFLLYNTVCQIYFPDPSKQWRKLNLDLFLEACHIQHMLSMYEETSELSQLNRSAQSGNAVGVSNELFSLLSLVFEASNLSERIFDPTVGPLMRLWNFRQLPPKVPSDLQISQVLRHTGSQYIKLDPKHKTITFLKPHMELDPGAWGKGYALECCQSLIKKYGISHAFLNFGSNLCILNNYPSSHTERWKIGIQKPWAPRGILSGYLSIPPCTVSTSAGYDNFFWSEGRLYHHIIDPRSGRPAVSSIISATVVCSSPLYADILSTIFFIGGEDAGKTAVNALQIKGYCGWLLIGYDGSIKLSSNLVSFFEKRV